MLQLDKPNKGTVMEGNTNIRLAKIPEGQESDTEDEDDPMYIKTGRRIF